MPTADPDCRGGARLDIAAGLNLIGTEGALKGQRVFAEFGAPVYQNLDGSQLETGWTLSIGAQVRF